MRPRQVPYEFLQTVEIEGTEATCKRIVRCSYNTSVNGTEMFQQVSFLFEHGDAESTGKRFLAGVYSKMSLQVPGHAELFAAIGTSVFSDGCRLWWILRRWWRGCSSWW